MDNSEITARNSFAEFMVTAPNRIDLAGGTTDLYPLYLLLDGGCTVNVGISVCSQVHVRPTGSDEIRVASKDLDAAVDAPDPSSLPLEGPLELICRAVRVLPPPSGIEIVTENHAPVGSGLGASSALLVALLKALLELRSEATDARAVVNLAADIETACIKVPAGKQDYIGAVYGGISLIEFGYGGFVRTSPDDSNVADELEARIILSYTGESRFSGMNNWDVSKKFIDDEDGVREKLRLIRDVARDVALAVSAGDWDALAELIDREWKIRRTLAPGVSSERIEAIMNAAESGGALASKICGAGGGGCMITFVSPEKRSRVSKAITRSGGRPIPFTIVRQGVTGERNDG